MRSSLIAGVTLLLGGAVSVPFIPEAPSVHERRDSLPHGWYKRDFPDKSLVLPMRIALTQPNLADGPTWLEEVSSPLSNRYGQHWTIEEVRNIFAPSDDSRDAVHRWLVNSGIDPSRISQSISGGFLEFSASVSEVEQLLHTQYHVYESQENGRHLACEDYTLPVHLKEHVDFIMPTVQLSKVGLKKRDDVSGGNSTPRPFAPNEGAPEIDSPAAATAGCDTQTTPDCLRQLYGFPKGTTALVKNALGVLELSPNYYSAKDLDVFFNTYSKAQVGQRPIFDSIDGGVMMNSTDYDTIVESNLDLQYAMSLVYPQNVTLYQTGDNVEYGDFNTFLDAIDGSYCTFQGGDDPNYDPVYPDKSTGGYKGNLQCGVFPPTKVISASYAGDEYFPYSPAYLRRQCSEYMKLGMMGVSVLFATGDYGVASPSAFGPQCYNSSSGELENSNQGGRFLVNFPASCPYVTAVGATQVIPGTNITQAIAKGIQPEEAAAYPPIQYYSAGGFSDVFPIPSYQNATVLSWFKNHKPAYSAAQYNNSMKARAIPDISANGQNYVIAVNGSFQLVNGTSASTPTLASILTLINEQRAAKNKSSIGFINPVAYANPQVFNDITMGNNPGCNTTGFAAVAGWDPVTGLGTANYTKMVNLWLSLS